VFDGDFGKGATPEALDTANHSVHDGREEFRDTNRDDVRDLRLTQNLGQAARKHVDYYERGGTGIQELVKSFQFRKDMVSISSLGVI
jgi:hypothetical protein